VSDSEDAQESLEEQLQRAAESHVAMARKAMAAGNTREAKDLLERTLRHARSAEALYLLSQLEMDHPSTTPQALEHLHEAVKLNPIYTAAWLALANYWGARGETAKQRRCLEKILTYDSKNHDVREALDLLAERA
jgi:Tfp pilus assembly protein PilF